MSDENNPFFLMGAMLGEKSGEVTDLRRRIEELQAKLAKQDDLVQAAVAAALREAVLQVHSYVPGHMLVSDTDRICDAIFALIPKGEDDA